MLHGLHQQMLTTKNGLSRGFLLERVGPAVGVSLLPLPFVLLVPLGLFITNSEIRPGPAVVAYSAAWAIGLAGTIRVLRKHWSGSAAQTTWSLVGGALLAVAVMAGVGMATAEWQDLMSQPDPTPFMVFLDLAATFAPLGAGSAAAWATLVCAAWARQSEA